jgi:hypothetical protein
MSGTPVGSIPMTRVPPCSGSHSTVPASLLARLPAVPEGRAVPEWPALVVERHVRIRATPQRVWEVLTDVGRWAAWDGRTPAEHRRRTPSP